MLSNKYTQLILSIGIVWLIITTFLVYGISVQKLDLERQKLNFEEWKTGKRAPLKFLNEKTYVPDKPYQIVRLDKIDIPLVRFDQQTGITEYWSVDGGGWVQIVDSGLQTAVPTDELKKRRAILDEWYGMLGEKVKETFGDKESFHAFYQGQPSPRIQSYFEYYKQNPQEWEKLLLESKTNE